MDIFEGAVRVRSLDSVPKRPNDAKRHGIPRLLLEPSRPPGPSWTLRLRPFATRRPSRVPQAGLQSRRISQALSLQCARCGRGHLPLKAEPRAFQVDEKVGLDDDNSRGRFGDVSLDLGDGRTSLDVTVVNLLNAARTCASRNSCSPADAEEIAFDNKVRKYADFLTT